MGGGPSEGRLLWVTTLFWSQRKWGQDRPPEGDHAPSLGCREAQLPRQGGRAGGGGDEGTRLLTPCLCFAAPLGNLS